MSIPKKAVKLTELRRRRCVNCNRLYRPRKEHQRFCTDRVPGQPNYCRREFHHNSSAYGPLKIKLEKLVHQIIRDEAAKLQQQINELRYFLDELRIAFTKRNPPPLS